MNALAARLARQDATVGIVGLGYVGLPLAVAFAERGFRVIGFDKDAARAEAIAAGQSHIPDVDAAALASLVEKGALTATADASRLAEADAIAICVPTPLSKTNDPDLSYVMDAAGDIAKTLRRGQLVVLESTTYPGTTDELLLPLFEGTGLRVGEDYYLAFSPERIDPGNPTFGVRNTPKVVGGVTAECTQTAVTLYGSIVDKVVPVSSTKSAEMVKLLENTFRSINIGLANEFALIANVLGVDIWEVIDAAATKPYGYMPFYPGPGLGGHCIPIDPHYLAWKLRALNYRARFIELASEVNSQMPRFVAEQVALALNEQGKCVNGAAVVVLGVAYKRDINDMRESPALDIIELLRERHADVCYADAYVPRIRVGAHTLEAVPLDERLITRADCVLIVTDHSNVDYTWVAKHASLVVDTRNATRGVGNAPNIWRLTQPQTSRERMTVEVAG